MRVNNVVDVPAFSVKPDKGDTRFHVSVCLQSIFSLFSVCLQSIFSVKVWVVLSV